MYMKYKWLWGCLTTTRSLSKLFRDFKGDNRIDKLGVHFEWTSKRQLAFDTLKDYLTHSPILIFPDPSKDIISLLMLQSTLGLQF